MIDAVKVFGQVRGSSLSNSDGLDMVIEAMRIEIAYGKLRARVMKFEDALEDKITSEMNAAVAVINRR